MAPKALTALSALAAVVAFPAACLLLLTNLLLFVTEAFAAIVVFLARASGLGTWLVALLRDSITDQALAAIAVFLTRASGLGARFLTLLLVSITD